MSKPVQFRLVLAALSICFAIIIAKPSAAEGLATWLIFCPGLFFASAIALVFFRQSPLRSTIFVALVSAASSGVVLGMLGLGGLIPFSDTDVALGVILFIMGGLGAVATLSALWRVYEFPQITRLDFGWFFAAGAVSQLVGGFLQFVLRQFEATQQTDLGMVTLVWWWAVGELVIRLIPRRTNVFKLPGGFA